MERWDLRADPQSKGIVEHLCGYAQSDLVVPLLTEAAVSGVPVSVRAGNVAAATWCAEVNAAVHSEIAAVPDERLATERELLAPLPSLRCEIGAPSVMRAGRRKLVKPRSPFVGEVSAPAMA